jgi:hypothetical protein|tara:strand:- start:57 stop:410 length:354 start_codon:yes stop_codon:yes gene_type:complete
MGINLTQRREWDKKVRLPDGITNLDTSTPIGAAATGAIIRTLNKATDIEDVGNVLQLANAVSTTDGNSAKTVIGVKETFIYADSNGVEHSTCDHRTAELYAKQGMTFVKTLSEDIMG